ncbi:Rv3654c family TadE-like protein [Knoellia sp. p5-6-4]|uniref:Rv3654c family TadE-like protein n=1 Tax=unclassified Knoellia TaxID=2618719 RepID=UPI0023DC9758|nr:Rv3654c family TadE-like protein [Knoellia sp. p5-6-4]MDF2144703.1 flp pilus-assembly TadE/G-like family protein [Knoellia sp. p5-6-4]
MSRGGAVGRGGAEGTSPTLRDRARGQRERGAATVLAVAAVGALLACLVGGLAFVGAVHAAHRARAGADLAVLAAASVHQRVASADSACSRAREIARANGCELRWCRADPDGTVSLAVTAPTRTPLPALRLGPAHAHARAGPVVPPGP